MCKVADYLHGVWKIFGINFKTSEIASASLQAPLSKHWSSSRRVCWTCSAAHVMQWKSLYKQYNSYINTCNRLHAATTEDLLICKQFSYMNFQIVILLKCSAYWSTTPRCVGKRDWLKVANVIQKYSYTQFSIWMQIYSVYKKVVFTMSKLKAGSSM